jgi:hypothetical protein
MIGGLKSILYACTNHAELDIYLGKAVECVGLIAEAVGWKLFANDAAEVMDYLMTTIVSAPSFEMTRTDVVTCY